MKEKSVQLSERLIGYGVKIIKICNKLNRSAIGKHIRNQLLSAGTSVGANYEEACGAQSKADFIHKLQIVLKEIREAMYWLKLIQESNILDGEEIREAIDETKQIIAIIGKSIKTAKERK